MNEIDEIGKPMPYKERDEYLEELIDHVTETAIKQHAAPRSGRRWRMATTAAAAAVVLLIIGVGGVVFNNLAIKSHGTPVQSPMDEFLESISDEEAAMLPCYEIEDIPEY
ncbi:MAG: hypothetical protein IKX18_04555 [Muribaculaceae bacterium]|nr:hypothetical protein [Muribaculaceae bacterium]